MIQKEKTGFWLPGGWIPCTSKSMIIDGFYGKRCSVLNIIVQLKPLKRKRVRAGHYTYAGFEIIKVTDYANFKTPVWNIFDQGEEYLCGYFTLKYAIRAIDSRRELLWNAIWSIENDVWSPFLL